METGATVKVSDSSFEKDVLQSSEPVLVDFYADWCGPCKAMAPALEQVATEMKGKVKVVKLDVDANPAITQKYNIQAMPTLMIFKAGKEANRRVGALVQKKQLADWVPVRSAGRSVLEFNRRPREKFRGFWFLSCRRTGERVYAPLTVSVRPARRIPGCAPMCRSIRCPTTTSELSNRKRNAVPPLYSRRPRGGWRHAAAYVRRYSMRARMVPDSSRISCTIASASATVPSVSSTT